MAMDGVLGQARAGWDHRRILGTFYQQTVYGKAGGTVRVGLSGQAEHAVLLPSGGTITDGEQGSGQSVRVPAGGRAVVAYSSGTYTVRLENVVGAAQILPTPDPSPEPTPEPGDDPGAEPGANPTPEPSGRAGLRSQLPVWVVGSGSPALVKLDATGRRYRGRMQLRWSENSGSLWAINHVDMETYIHGIAEEKGQGWPAEGLKSLAVAARSLAAATQTWYDRHHANGFDICPTGMCQLYLGYDGEEPAMTAASKATAGDILTYGGRPILGMYHGNGGGRTESWAAHPYLRAVTYAHASPKSWTRSFTPASLTSALRAAGVAVPGEVVAVNVMERGDSPRVRKARVVGTAGDVEATGGKIKDALDLPSAWFDVRFVTGAVVTAEAAQDPATTPMPTRVVRFQASASQAPQPASGPAWPQVALTVALFAVAVRAAGHDRLRRPPR
jgi:SpoIID/LytB domain protein